MLVDRFTIFICLEERKQKSELIIRPWKTYTDNFGGTVPYLDNF